MSARYILVQTLKICGKRFGKMVFIHPAGSTNIASETSVLARFILGFRKVVWCYELKCLPGWWWVTDWTREICSAGVTGTSLMSFTASFAQHMIPRIGCICSFIAISACVFEIICKSNGKMGQFWAGFFRQPEWSLANLSLPKWSS